MKHKPKTYNIETLKKIAEKWVPLVRLKKELYPKMKFPSYGSFREYLRVHPDLADHINNLWESRKEEVGEEVVSELFAMMFDRENVKCGTRASLIMFYLKTQHGWRETDKKEETPTEPTVKII